MVNPTDGTKVTPHGMFYMEGAGGYHTKLDAHERIINEARPSL
jgi:hypothetical protein